jgi:exonuclease III
VLIEFKNRKVLLITVYIQAKENQEDIELQEKIGMIQTIVQKIRRQHSSRVELIITGDFNRHDQLWGGSEVAQTSRQGEDEAIIEMMAELDLQLLLKRGTKTW